MSPTGAGAPIACEAEPRADHADVGLAGDLGPSRTILPFCGAVIEDHIPLGVDGIPDPDNADAAVRADVAVSTDTTHAAVTQD